MSFQVQGLHHIGLTVRDIKKSFEWYSHMFGLKPGPLNEASGEGLSKGVQLPDVSLTFSFLDIGTTRIEFLQYHSPEGRDFVLRNCDVGATHICLQVDNMESAYSTLEQRGAVFNAPRSLLPRETWPDLNGHISEIQTAFNWRFGHGQKVTRTTLADFVAP